MNLRAVSHTSKTPTTHRCSVAHVVVLFSWITLAACDAPIDAPEAVAAARPGLTFTSWNTSSELFAELPALVVGEESPCAAHATRLADFLPLTEGRVVLALVAPDGTEERWEVAEITRPGIFRPIARPTQPGPRRLRVEIHAEGIDDVHDLGDVTVFASEDAARQSIDDEAEVPGRITFLKEQQWVIPFMTAAVEERSLRASLALYGRIEARPEGDVSITAPSAGRIADDALPALGASIARDAIVASLAPQLDSADRASLDLASASARMEVAQTERERARIEGLAAQGVVAERRLVEARHEEDEARATLAAATRRQGMFARTLRTGGGHGGALPLRSPITGDLVAIEISPGAFVEAGDVLFRVVAPGSLWLALDVPEANLPSVGATLATSYRLPGDATERELGPDALVSRPRVVDPTTHLAVVRFRVDDPQIPLGAHVEARLFTDEATTQLAIPASAVLDDGGYFVAFVQVEGEAFERRPLRLGTRDGDLVGVVSGLSAGEHVVTRGALAVKLAGASGAVPAHGHAH